MKIKSLVFLFLSTFIHPAGALDLLETYQLAVQNDPKLKQVYFTQLSIAENKSQRIAQMLPTLSIAGKSSRERLNNKKRTFQSAGVQKYWNHGFSIHLFQPVFHWEHWIQLEQSDNLISKAEANYQAAHQNLIVLTTEAYFNILSAQDNVQFSIAEKKAIARQLEQAKQRFDVGLIAITDVHEARAGYDETNANLISAKNSLEDSKEALREIIAENEINVISLSRGIDFTPPVPNNIVEWTKNAESNNFSIIAALNQAEVQRKNIAIQQAGHLPTVDIVANYNIVDVNSSFGLRGDTQSIGLEVNIPVFQGGLISSRSNQARFDYLAAKEDLLSTKRAVKRQIRNSFRDVISSLSRIEALKATVVSSQSALEATEAGFEVGTRTMVDVLTEQRNLYRSKRDYSKSRYNYIINGVKLKQAAGSLSAQDIKDINQYFKTD